MTANRQLRSIFRRHILRPGPQIKVNRNFNLIRQHIQEELIQERHYNCLRSLMSFISLQLFNVLKFLPNHFLSMRLDEVLLFLQARQTSHFFLSSVHCKLDFNPKSHTLALHSSPLHFGNNQVTLARSM